MIDIPWTAKSDASPLILVLVDVEETRDGIERLLKTNGGYRVDSARDEEDAVARACRVPPDLILMSLNGPRVGALAAAVRVCKRAQLHDTVPVVIFCDETIPEGAEVEIRSNIFVTRPDNFDQLRNFLRRLLHRQPPR